MRGIIVFYLNTQDSSQNVQENIDMMMKINQVVIDRIQKESEYLVAIVPTFKEACRIEKVDFDKPHPRYLPKTHSDIGELDRRRAEREKERQELARLKKMEEEMQ